MMSISASIVKIGLLGCLLAGCVGVASAQSRYFDNWPAGVAPAEVGKKLAEHFLTSSDAVHEDGVLCGGGDLVWGAAVCGADA